VSRDIRTIVGLSYTSGQRRTGDVRGFLAIPERGASVRGILTRLAKTPKRFQEVSLAAITWFARLPGSRNQVSLRETYVLRKALALYRRVLAWSFAKTLSRPLAVCCRWCSPPAMGAPC
jgi:hypothetical protein